MGGGRRDGAFSGWRWGTPAGPEVSAQGCAGGVQMCCAGEEGVALPLVPPLLHQSQLPLLTGQRLSTGGWEIAQWVENRPAVPEALVQIQSMYLSNL